MIGTWLMYFLSEVFLCTSMHKYKVMSFCVNFLQYFTKGNTDGVCGKGPVHTFTHVFTLLRPPPWSNLVSLTANGCFKSFYWFTWSGPWPLDALGTFHENASLAFYWPTAICVFRAKSLGNDAPHNGIGKFQCVWDF